MSDFKDAARSALDRAADAAENLKDRAAPAARKLKDGVVDAVKDGAERIGEFFSERAPKDTLNVQNELFEDLEAQARARLEAARRQAEAFHFHFNPEDRPPEPDGAEGSSASDDGDA